MTLSTPLQMFDLALRAGLFALMLFVAALLWRDHGRSAAGRLGSALAVGVAAYAVQSWAGFGGWPAAWRAPVAVLSTGNAVVFWLFSRALFDDDFRWRPAHAVAWGALGGLALFGCVAGAPTRLVLLITVGTIAFAVLAVAQSVASWQADLVEKRRRLRVFIVAAGAGYTVAHMAPRLLDGAPAGEGAALADVLALSAIAVAVAWQVLRSPAEVLFAPQGKAEPVVPAAPGPAPVDAALVAAIDRLMRGERVYREEGLTIARLAERLAVPEYKLRRAINQGLGHRNFNAFLNRYRVEEVKAALADPAQAPVPVLTLALDAGFQSLGPFNRAFKAETGVTPTEFRKSALG